MAKMSNATRDAIVENAVIKAGLRKAQEILAAKRKELAYAVRNEAAGGRIKELEAFYAAKTLEVRDFDSSLPQSFRMHVDAKREASVYVLFEGMRSSIRLFYNGRAEDDSEKFDQNIYECTPFSAVKLPGDHPFRAVYDNICAGEMELRQKIESVRVQVKGTLSEFHSVANLLKAWPEAAELLPPDAIKVKPQLPAVPVANLNALIGLPTGEDK